jgi:hypothetical protein
LAIGSAEVQAPKRAEVGRAEENSDATIGYGIDGECAVAGGEGLGKAASDVVTGLADQSQESVAGRCPGGGDKNKRCEKQDQTGLGHKILQTRFSKILLFASRAESRYWSLLYVSVWGASWHEEYAFLQSCQVNLT